MGMFSNDEYCDWSEYYHLKQCFDNLKELLQAVYDYAEKSNNQELINFINDKTDMFKPTPNNDKMLEYINSEEFKKAVEPYKNLSSK